VNLTGPTADAASLSCPGARAWSIVVEDRADATILGEQRIAAVAEQVQVERLVRFLLAVALDFDRDRLRRLAGGTTGVRDQESGVRFRRLLL